MGLVVPPLLFEAMIQIRSDDLKAVDQTGDSSCDGRRFDIDDSGGTDIMENCQSILSRLISFCCDNLADGYCNSA